MAWSAPKVDFASGNVVTAAQMNALGNNLRFLKGLDGDISIEDDVLIADARGLVVGHTAKLAAWGGVTPELQVLSVDNAGSTIVIGQWNADNALQPVLNFIKSGHGTIGSTTPVADNETIGAIYWTPDDSSNFQNLAASFHAEVDDGSPVTDGVGSAFVWKQQVGDGTDAARETLRIAADGTVFIANTGGLVIGHTAQVQAWDTYELQALGTVSPDSGVIIGNWSTSTGMPPVLNFVKSLNASIGSTTIVSDNTQLGGIYWTPDDGADIRNLAARFFAEVDDPHPEETGVGTAFVWSHQPGNGTGAARETWRITAAGDLTSAGAGFDLDMNSAGTILNVGAAGNDWTANSFTMNSANAGSQNQLVIVNSSTSPSSSAEIYLSIDGTNTSSDVFITFNRTIGTDVDWAVGMDNSNTQAFVISRGVDPGTNDAMRISTGGATTFDDSSGSDFTPDYICEQCGKTELTAFLCCGEVRWHDDALALRQGFESSEGLAHLVKLGVYEVDGPNDADPGWTGINIQKGMHLTWGAVWQNRERMDDQYAELKAEIETLKGRG